MVVSLPEVARSIVVLGVPEVEEVVVETWVVVGETAPVVGVVRVQVVVVVVEVQRLNCS